MREIVAIALALVLTGGLARAADTPVATTSLVVRNRPDPENPSGRKILWRVKDASVVAGTRGTADDPRCVGAGGGGGGGSIRVFSDRSEGSTEDTGDISLPCANWKAIGREANPTGYVYDDGDQSTGPCRRVVVTAGGGVKATCTARHAPIDYDLTTGTDEGDVGVVLRVGIDDRYCASVDATGAKDGSDGRMFLGRHASAPSACPIPFVCGDAHIVSGEQCDDGNLTTGDGCDTSCQVEDGYTCAGEPSSCALVCSDGTLDPGETCDDGNVANGDGCDAACQIEDGYQCTGEPSVCGLICSDGTLDAGETCDDGNLTNGDGCDATCQTEGGFACTGEPSTCALICSDGTLDPGETCDDGNLTNGDGCSATCQTEDHYDCTGEPSVCTTPCGDGLIIGREECDDGGATPGDGCSDTCTIEDGYACAGAPSACTPGCGDGTVAGSEQCDDANAIVGDGCSVHCAYEPLCLVTRDAGNPSHATLTKIAPDGSVVPVTGIVLPGNDTALSQTLAVCGRRVYFNLSQAIAGLEVGLDGTVTALPTFPLTDSFQINTIDRIACSPVQDLVMTFETAGLFSSEVTSYRVDATTGALTQVGRVFPAGSSFGRYYIDFHPITHDVYYAVNYDPPLGATPLQVTFGRIVYDAAGNLGVADQYTAGTGFLPKSTIDGLRFTADGDVLALFAFFDNSFGPTACFGQFNSPGTGFPPEAALNRTCSGPVPPSWRTFVPRPEGGPIVYWQQDIVTTGQFVGTTIAAVSTTPGLNAGFRLLGTFDGRRLVGLGGGDGTIATYDVASDLVTVTPNDVAPIGASPLDGVLLPCPGL